MVVVRGIVSSEAQPLPLEVDGDDEIMVVATKSSSLKVLVRLWELSSWGCSGMCKLLPLRCHR